jgi:hypothetical protein
VYGQDSCAEDRRARDVALTLGLGFRVPREVRFRIDSQLAVRSICASTSQPFVRRNFPNSDGRVRVAHTSTRPWRTRTRSCERAPKRTIPVAATGASLSSSAALLFPVLACVLADAAPSQTRRRGRRWIRTTRRPLRSRIMGSLHAATAEVRFYAWIRASRPAGLPAHADADAEAAEKGEDEKARASGMRDREIPQLVRGAPT